MNTYDRIARVIHYLDQHRTEQPDLATLARHVGLSPFHFHRLFSQWVGVTPRDFLQCLTLADARQRLREGNSVLEAAILSGLSGPGRLHDLCVKLTAASPGELKSGGKGWTIRYGFAESPFGRCLVAESPRGICHLAFVESNTGRAELAELGNAWPYASLRQDRAAAQRLANRVFKRPSQADTRPALRAFVQGTPFQVQVWRALMHVEPGTLITYSQLAKALGRPAAARAVGTAVGKNPLACLIPCHRVVRETGVSGHYRWGRERKRAIVAWESSQRMRNTVSDPDASLQRLSDMRTPASAESSGRLASNRIDRVRGTPG